MTRIARFSRLALLPLLLAAASSLAHAGRGAAELTLDRGSVAGLIEAALPPPLRIEIPGFGMQSIALGAPREIEFHEGGIEMKLPLRVGELRLPARLEVRFEPAVERVEGAVELLPVRIALVGIPALPLDLASWVEPVSLPRRVQWNLPLDGGRSLQVDGFVQGLRVLDDRLQLALSLAASRSPGEQGSR